MATWDDVLMQAHANCRRFANIGWIISLKGGDNDTLYLYNMKCGISIRCACDYSHYAIDKIYYCLKDNSDNVYIYITDCLLAKKYTKCNIFNGSFMINMIDITDLVNSWGNKFFNKKNPTTDNQQYPNDINPPAADDAEANRWYYAGYLKGMQEAENKYKDCIDQFNKFSEKCDKLLSVANQIKLEANSITDITTDALSLINNYKKSEEKKSE